MPAAATAETTFTRGDKVVIKGDLAPANLLGQVFVVERVNPRNVIARPATGTGRGINYPKDALDKYDGEVPEHGRVPVSVPLPEIFGEGTIVTFRTPPKGVAADAAFVVIRDTGADKCNVAPLGGSNNGAYYRAVKRGLVKRDVAWLTAHLVDNA